MGVDFVRKCAKGFEKSWDRGKRELATPDLFRRDPSMAARTYCAIPTNGTGFGLGREFLARVVNDQICLYDGLSVVGALKDPPSSLATTIQQDGCGVAVAKVVHSHEFSGAADVLIA